MKRVEKNNGLSASFPPFFYEVHSGQSRSCKRDNTIVYALSRVFLFFRVHLWIYFCFASLAILRAEFDSGDSANLTTIKNTVGTISGIVSDSSLYLRQIELDVGSIDDNVSTLKNYNAYILGQFGYGLGSSQVSSVKSDFDALKQNSSDSLDYLQRIEDYLSNIEAILESNGDTGGSGGESTTINQDWLKEDTFKTYSDWVKSSFGFTGGTGTEDTLKSLISPFYDTWINGYSNDLNLYYFVQNTRPTLGLNTPFPVTNNNGRDGLWYDLSEPRTYLMPESYKDPFKFLADVFVQQAYLDNQFSQGLLKKQSWNDWYAHTNLVSTLENLLTYSVPEQSINGSSSFGGIKTDEVTGDKTLDITWEKSTGDSAESIELTPSFTNDLSQLTMDSNSITNRFNNIFDYTNIKNRYLSNSKIITNNSYNDPKTSDVGNYTFKYGSWKEQTFEWTAKSTNLYRSVFSYELMKFLRSTFDVLWKIFAALCNFALFKRLGRVD